jgi:hypothetical protein
LPYVETGQSAVECGQAGGRPNCGERLQLRQEALDPLLQRALAIMRAANTCHHAAQALHVSRQPQRRRRVLQHLQRARKVGPGVQDRAQLLPYPRRLDYPSQPIQAGYRLPVVSLRGIMGRLFPRRVTGLLQVRQSSVRHIAAPVVVGQHLSRRCTGTPIERFSRPPVQECTSSLPEVAPRHLANHIVDEPVGVVAHFLQQTGPAGLLQGLDHL